MRNGKQIRKPGIPVAPKKVKDVRLVAQLTRLIFGVRRQRCIQNCRLRFLQYLFSMQTI